METGPASNPAGTAFNTRLESLRGVAALMVAIGHSFLVLEMSGPLWRLVKASFIVFNGRAAVTLFFVMSGYVLGLSLKRSREPFWRGTLTFMFRRFFRIYPALIVTTLVFYLFLHLGWTEPALSWGSNWFHLVMPVPPPRNPSAGKKPSFDRALRERRDMEFAGGDAGFRVAALSQFRISSRRLARECCDVSRPVVSFSCFQAPCRSLVSPVPLLDGVFLMPCARRGRDGIPAWDPGLADPCGFNGMLAVGPEYSFFGVCRASRRRHGSRSPGRMCLVAPTGWNFFRAGFQVDSFPGADLLQLLSGSFYLAAGAFSLDFPEPVALVSFLEPTGGRGSFSGGIRGHVSTPEPLVLRDHRNAL